MNTITIHETRYYGIWSQEENGEWFLISANGDESHVGRTQPTDEQITLFRNELVRY